jgi:hypothetical protein
VEVDSESLTVEQTTSSGRPAFTLPVQTGRIDERSVDDRTWKAAQQRTAERDQSECDRFVFRLNASASRDIKVIQSYSKSNNKSISFFKRLLPERNQHRADFGGRMYQCQKGEQQNVPNQIVAFGVTNSGACNILVRLQTATIAVANLKKTKKIN